jgi:predicted transcriptional regulator
MLLIAEALTIDPKILLTLGSIVFGAGGFYAVMKVKQAFTDKSLDSVKKSTAETDKQILSKIEDLTKTMTHQFKEQNTKQAQSEKSMIGKIEDFKTIVVGRIDDVQKGQAQLDKRITLAESEHRHIKEKVDKHGKKITMMGHISRPPTYPGTE